MYDLLFIFVLLKRSALRSSVLDIDGDHVSNRTKWRSEEYLSRWRWTFFKKGGRHYVSYCQMIEIGTKSVALRKGRWRRECPKWWINKRRLIYICFVQDTLFSCCLPLPSCINGFCKLLKFWPGIISKGSNFTLNSVILRKVGSAGVLG